MNTTERDRKFHCQICKLDVNDWIATETKNGILKKADFAFLYCPRCGAFLGKGKITSHNAKITNILAVSNKGGERVELATDKGVFTLALGESFEYRKEKLRIIPTGTGFSVEQFNLSQNKWNGTSIRKKTMSDCVLALERNSKKDNSVTHTEFEEWIKLTNEFADKEEMASRIFTMYDKKNHLVVVRDEIMGDVGTWECKSKENYLRARAVAYADLRGYTVPTIKEI